MIQKYILNSHDVLKIKASYNGLSSMIRKNIYAKYSQYGINYAVY